MSLLKLLESSEGINKLLISKKEKLNYISPLSGSLKTILVKFFNEKEDQILLLLPDVQTVNEIKVELELLGCGNYLVSVEDNKIDSLQEKLTLISNKKKFILLSTYEIIKVSLPAKNQLDNRTTKIQLGGGITYDELIEYLNLLNYQKTKFVEGVGDYAIRGSIVDFWSYSEANPCRIEFDGDFIESIRHFDSESQRSADKTEVVSLAGNFENAETIFTSDIFDYLDNPLVIANKYDLNSLFKKTEIVLPSAFDGIVIEDIELAQELLGNIKPAEIKIDDGKRNNLKESTDLSSLLKKRARWLIENPFDDVVEKINLNITEPPTINSNFDRLFNTLQDFSNKDYKIIITSENEFQSKRLYDLLADYKEELAELIETGKVKIETLALRKGFILRNEKLLVLTDYQIFNKPYRSKISSIQREKKSRTKDFASIKKGDFVVHENFGIGQYVGLETIKIGEVSQESIKILYAEGGIVYVNLNYFNLVKKFSSKEGEEPKLNSLSSGEWDSTKKKVKKKIKEAARELIQLYAKRKASQGFTFSADTIWQKELEASFIYEDTPDQSKVSDEVKNDMESKSPMDRLVCGDVGFGKTEIAVRAAFKAANDGKQTALLVPTTILAEQHLNTFKDRLSQFPVKVEVLSRFHGKAKQKDVVKELGEGKVDVIIGTHRLLSKDVQFKDLGLLIIDEEHRFGVMAKEKLKNFRVNVDTLTLTATPIPRTLNLSLLGARDLSIIATPPPNRQPIYTLVQTFDVQKVREWIMNELKRAGQVYFVHDRVQSINKIADYLNKYIPEIKIGIAHGQMKPLQLENVIYDFLNRKYDVLLCTKIIESGIDIPNVNTIIVNRADRFGLAELHQLRGRVGRSDRQAYAYFLVPSLDSINKKSVRRLQAIEEFTDVGAGFNLSMRDLEIRGAGNLLGTEQTGFIDAVGFEMYVKLLDEAVEELKRLEFAEVFKELPKPKLRTDPTIDAYFEIGIPKAYMPDQADRLSFYTALFSIKNLEEAKEITDELRDRFGKPPIFVERLVATAILKYYASFALFERIIIQQKNILIILPKGANEDYYKERFTALMKFILENYFNEIKFDQQKETLKLIIPNRFENPEKIYEYLFEFCRRVRGVVNNL
ncbi:MAG: transcription-repair coupling factor [Ignavibacteriales bacterium]|nr:transcription-repair coupling factor [Ignavibacteriales bacterium]